MSDYELARRWVGSPGHLHITAGDVRMVEGLLAEIDRLRAALAAPPQPLFEGSPTTFRKIIGDDILGPDLPREIVVYPAVAGSATPTEEEKT